MSRLTGSDALGLYEAYQAVYDPQELTEEQVWEEVETWVNSLVEEGYDLSDYTWEEMYESYLSEMGQARTTGQNSSVFTLPKTPSAGSAGGSGSGGRRGSGSSPGGLVSTSRPKPQFGTTTPKGSSVTSTGVSGLSAADRAAYSAGGGNAAAQKGMGRTSAQVIAQGKTNLGRMDQGRPAPAGARPTSGGSSTNPKSGLSAYSATKPAAKPATSTPATTPAASARPAAGASAAPKPTAATAPAAKPAGSAMDQFAKANPKLAASAAERDRTRGTSATTNPLMKDMKSRLPAPKTPSPTTAKTGFDLAKKGVNLAASFDMFDVVKGYLIGEGYADTEEAALAIMANMSEEWKQSIVESKNA
jgi:hypothetical protein